jgi:DNA-binding response OmpR family regulator
MAALRQAPVVVVADAHEDTRFMLQTLLTAHGFDVVPCSDGAVTVAKARWLGPAAVVLDLVLLGIDGLSVLRALRRGPDTAQVPVIFTSTQGAEVARLAYDAGCDAYLLKPIDVDELVTLVEQFSTTPRIPRPASTETSGPRMPLHDHHVWPFVRF